MPYTKEQLRTYWQTHKEQINFRRREKRRLARLAMEKVSHSEIDHITANPKTANPQEVNHGKPTKSKPYSTANPEPVLARLVKEWQTATNYSCSPTCFYSYCSNCWYFADNQLVDYKQIKGL